MGGVFLLNFNPRSRTGSDLREKIQLRRMGNISIHAPAQGTTCGWAGEIKWDKYFNPRSRTGSDCWTFPPFSRRCDFNPRSRTGSDMERRKKRVVFYDFNPRSRTGSDGMIPGFIDTAKDFNPRSRTGSDSPPLLTARTTSNFNPRSRTGSDPFSSCDTFMHLISTHAPAQGATYGKIFLEQR